VPIAEAKPDRPINKSTIQGNCLQLTATSVDCHLSQWRPIQNVHVRSEGRRKCFPGAWRNVWIRWRGPTRRASPRCKPTGELRPTPDFRHRATGATAHLKTATVALTATLQLQRKTRGGPTYPPRCTNGALRSSTRWILPPAPPSWWTWHDASDPETGTPQGRVRPPSWCQKFCVWLGESPTSKSSSRSAGIQTTRQ